MKPLLDAAAAMGLVGCTLSVLASNLPARRLYERLGFVATGDDVRLHMAMSLLAPPVDTGRVVPP